MVWSNKLLLASTFLILPGDPDTTNGGYRAYNNFGDGLLYNLNVAAKSTEGSYSWGVNNGATNAVNSLSRLNGALNTTIIVSAAGANAPAAVYADGLSFSGQTDWYLGAIDELRAISARLKPSAATSTLFQTGGSEVYASAVSWSSTELTSANASYTDMTNGADAVSAKTTSYLVRPIRRFVTDMPFPIGTAMEGGYLAAYFTDLSSGAPLTYFLIVADKATEVTRAYQTSASSLGGAALSRTNGSVPSEAAVTNSAAMYYCQQLVSGTKTDWYLPAVDELLAIKRIEASLPSGQRLSTTENTWTSTEVNSTTAMVVGPAGGNSSPPKTTVYPVRAVRRVLLP